ncbi:MAG TPA: hypothetical protein VGG71_11185, partial [Chitinophagaceae bacterium]
KRERPRPLFHDIVESTQSSLSLTAELVAKIDSKTRELYDEKREEDANTQAPDPPFLGIAFGMAVNHITIDKINKMLRTIAERLDRII